MQIGWAEEWSHDHKELVSPRSCYYNYFLKDTNGADVIAVSVILMHDLPSLLKLFSHPVQGRFYTKYSRFP